MTKRPVESATANTMFSRLDEHTLPAKPTASMEARKSTIEALSFESTVSLVSPTAAVDATALAAPSPVAVAANPNLLTPDVIASSQQDRVVSCAGKDHAFIPTNIAHMRSLPYSAVNSRRFILNEDQFFRDITGAS